MLRTVRQFNTLPQLPASGPMPPIVSVVLPLDRVNLITNPSIELATTGYTAVGGSIARSAAAQYHGTYSLAVTPSAGTNSDGAFYGTVSLTSGTPYAYSTKFKATGAGIGKTYALSVATTGGVDLAAVQFVATGRWQWIRGVYGETATNSRRIYIRKVNHSAASVFYVDGWQVESCADGILDATTYIDGDQLGLLVGQQPPPYLWTGTPHASTSSRSILTRAGGYLMNLQDAYGFLITAVIGLGMAAPNNVSVPYTVLDGARYLRTTKPQRTFTLPGRFQADDDYSLSSNQSDMRAALDRDLVPIQQPLVLVVEPQDECGNVNGDFAQIQCIYAGGLEGNETSLPVEDAAPAFTMYIPFLFGGDAGASLTVQQTVTNANRILQRNVAGVWSAMGTGAASTDVHDIVVGLDGKVYATGAFSGMGGVANTAGIAYWDGSAWNAMGTGLSGGNGDCLAVAPNGDIIVGGTFTLAGGVANTVRIARWNGSTWNALSTGANGTVQALTYRSNILFAGGTFTSIGGVATSFIAQWNGSAWSAVAGGAFNSAVQAFAVAPNGTLYAGGTFTTINAVTRNRVASWNGSTWSALGTGTDSSVRALARGNNGILYAGGDFTTAGGVSAPNLAAWNGTAWSPLGSGVNAAVDELAVDLSGVLWVGGEFTTAGDITLAATGLARWNGSAWIPPDVTLPAAVVAVYAVVPAASGQLYLGWDGSAGSATTAAVTTVPNGTPSVVYPVLTIRGPSSGTANIYLMVNNTTTYGVWLRPYTIQAGEVATWIFDPAFNSFRTNNPNVDDGGDLSFLIAPGSQPTFMFLAPGNNSVSFYASDATVTATLAWRNRYNGTADLVN